LETIQFAFIVGGIIYGIILIVGMFVRTKFTELVRLDSVFMPKPSESTRIINLVFGILILGYNTYELLKWIKVLR